MKVAVIGATGFVGGYLVDALLDAGHRPSVLVRTGSGATTESDGSVRPDHVVDNLNAAADLIEKLIIP